ncbi:hypothetical protein PPTG_16246 [Phytophthora nicotianae INRA-310]|uniref:Alcohol dehydrogenase-like C-terminal domain-containing protein n=1 Tax=Phytophthora nicotianae (strain INRA-310) TaxID=761204 RepID=W2PP37_PHYN3|nr:hypothetical protein PPTG_16246 [Phytophthora nicotianae INRA-310]ETN02642.1 hypothetical protein PPTG_16246 [Phytophthora nicotianae INRA-310]
MMTTYRGEILPLRTGNTLLNRLQRLRSSCPEPRRHGVCSTADRYAQPQYLARCLLRLETCERYRDIAHAFLHRINRATPNGDTQGATVQIGECKPWQFEPRPLGAEDVEIKVTHCYIPLTADGVPRRTRASLDMRLLATSLQSVGGSRASPSVTASVLVRRHGVASSLSTPPTKTVPHQQGGFADFIRVDNNYAFKITDALQSDAATPLMCAGATVFKPLKQEDVKSGDRATSPSSSPAVPVAFPRSSKKEKEIRSLGVEEFYDLINPDRQKKAAGSADFLLLTADAKDVAYDLYPSLVYMRGTFIMVGLPPNQVKITPWFLVPRATRVRGSAIGSIQNIKDMLGVAAKNNARPIIEKMPMSEVNKGLDKVRDGSVRYCIVLVS